MTDPTLEHWATFFSATSNAAGALVGLIFVALSVNVQQIVKSPGLPERAGATVATLLLVLAGSLSALIYEQTTLGLGIEVCILGFIVWLLQIIAARLALTARRQGLQQSRRTTAQIVIGQIQVLPYLAGGVLLVMNHRFGLRCLAAGSVTAFICALLNAWVLLIEILR